MKDKLSDLQSLRLKMRRMQEELKKREEADKKGPDYVN
jgi:hypothetical protein